MVAPLSGVRVIELGQYVTGPEAGVLLADLGAEVLKVENPRAGDPFRGWTDGGGYNANFRSLNRNKKSIALDVASEEGSEALRRLVDTADVLIENFRVGQAERWGWGYDVLAQRNSRLIYLSISGFGSTGPYRDRPGYDTIGQAMSGLLSVLTDLDAPSAMGISLSDHLTGVFGAYGVLAALAARDRTGVGQLVETSLLQASIAFMSENVSGYLTDGTVPSLRRRAQGAGVWAFVAGDGKPLVIHLSAPAKFWEGLVSCLGRPEWITDPRYADRIARRTNYDELHGEMAQIFATKSRAEWLEQLVEADVPAAPLYSLDEVFEDPQVKALEMVRTVEHPVMGTVALAAPGISMSGTPLSLDLAPPLLGEHTREILGLAGYSETEIDHLCENKTARAWSTNE